MRKRKNIVDRDKLNFEEEPVSSSLADTTSLPSALCPVTADLKFIEDSTTQLNYQQEWVNKQFLFIIHIYHIQ